MKLRERPETSSSQTLRALRKVQLEILTNEGKLQQFREALCPMGCAELLDVPLGVRKEGLMLDLIRPLPNTWDNTLTGHPEEWTPAVWREVYRFRKGRM